MLVARSPYEHPVVLEVTQRGPLDTLLFRQMQGIREAFVRLIQAAASS